MSSPAVTVSSTQRSESPSPSVKPIPAVIASSTGKSAQDGLPSSSTLSVTHATRSVSANSSYLSETGSVFSRAPSFGNESQLSVHSSGSNSSSNSHTGSVSQQVQAKRAQRRGFIRPQGTYFAASARQRQSVLSLGSITHIQYYFARTGLLDGRSGQHARKAKDSMPATYNFSHLTTAESSRSSSQESSSRRSPSFGPGQSQPSSVTSKALVESPVDEQMSSHLSPMLQPSEDGPTPRIRSRRTSGYSDGAGSGGRRVRDARSSFHGDGFEDEVSIDVDIDEEELEGEDFVLDSSFFLPPTVSTYHEREPNLEPLPPVSQLREDLEVSLASAAKTIQNANAITPLVQQRQNQEDQLYQEQIPHTLPPSQTYAQLPPVPPLPPVSPHRPSHKSQRSQSQGPPQHRHGRTPSSRVRVHRKEEPHGQGKTDDDDEPLQGFYELQGMQILDVMTLAIRSAKLYYTAHEHPERLDAIRPEKELRADLLHIMEVLHAMARREFSGGMQAHESQAMHAWIEGVQAMLQREDKIVEEERLQRSGWTWLYDAAWVGKSERLRDMAFLTTLDPSLAPFFQDDTTKPAESETWTPSRFMLHLRNGLQLIRVHNAAVRLSHRRFGAIGSFHTDTQKPYRCADNLRYWRKAAELRWEILEMPAWDVLGVIYDLDGRQRPDLWKAFEASVWIWTRRVRQELTRELLA